MVAKHRTGQVNLWDINGTSIIGAVTSTRQHQAGISRLCWDNLLSGRAVLLRLIRGESIA